MREPALTLAGRIAARTGCALLSEFNSARIERGAGRVVTQRIPYVVDDALAMLRKTVGGRDAMLHTVYDYWASKRKRTGKPMMRRLQAPTPANDTNPYNVFR